MTSLNDYVWTGAGTDVEIRWKKYGWVRPSENAFYIKKWADWKAKMAQTHYEVSIPNQNQKIIKFKVAK